MSSTREYDVIFEPQPGGGYTVYVPDLPGCVSEGDMPPKIERRKLTPA